MARSFSPVLVLCALAVAGCSRHSTPPAMLHRSLPVEVRVDLLFVVDNSGSMLAEQQALGAAFPALLDVLGQARGELPDLHLGVLSSNAGSAGQGGVPGCPLLGDDGNLLTGAPGSACAATYGLANAYVSDAPQPDGSRLVNYAPGQLAPLFACMAALGNTGCGFEMHLESMYRALQPGKNAGFLRDDAWLGVIFLADEDDCSTEDGVMFGDPTATLTSPLGPRTSFRCHEFGAVCEDDPDPRAFGPRTGCRPRTDSPYMYSVSRYVDFLGALKSDPERVVVGGLIGDFDAGTGALTVGPDPNFASYPAVEKSCHGVNPADPNDGATPAVRLQAFLRAFPGRSSSSSVCDADLSGGLTQFGRLLKAAVGDPCIDRALADGEAGQPGLQPRCTVTDVVGESRQPIPACPEAVQSLGSCDPGAASTPCWCIHPDAAQCPPGAANPQSWKIDVARGGVAPATGTVVEVACELEG